MTILGITPARGKSKGISRKNLKEMCGKPLIVWTIEAAKSSQLLDRYVISTEDREIAKLASQYNVEVIERPAYLAKDKVTSLEVIQHVLKKIRADIIVLLQCTSPVRDDGLVDLCIQRFLKTKADSLATGFICNFLEWGKYSLPRQMLKGFFHDDGNVCIVKAEKIKKAKSWNDVWGRKREKMIIGKEQNLEIDDQFDFWLNEQILKKRLGLL